MRPPFQPDTWALWLGPFAVLLAGGAGVALYVRGRSRAAAVPLSAQDEAEAAALLTTEENPT